MIEALFNQPNYLVAKKALDVARLRQEAIAANIANLETPNYKRVDIAPEFAAELRKAAAAGDARRIGELQPAITVDPAAVANSKDGNTVTLESELLRMSQNTVENALQTQLVSGTLTKLRMAITGKTL
jgi:flagellar basal-body rod protein FlgB